MRVEFNGATAKDRVKKDYTLVDYLSLPQPRTTYTEQALAQLVEEHGKKLDFSRLETPELRKAEIDKTMQTCTSVDPSTVHSIDWWCDKISKEGVELRHGKQQRLRETLRRSTAGQLPQ